MSVLDLDEICGLFDETAGTALLSLDSNVDGCVSGEEALSDGPQLLPSPSGGDVFVADPEEFQAYALLVKSAHAISRQIGEKPPSGRAVAAANEDWVMDRAHQILGGRPLARETQLGLTVLDTKVTAGGVDLLIWDDAGTWGRFSGYVFTVHLTRAGAFFASVGGCFFGLDTPLLARAHWEAWRTEILCGLYGLLTSAAGLVPADALPAVRDHVEAAMLRTLRTNPDPKTVGVNVTQKQGRDIALARRVESVRGALGTRLDRDLAAPGVPVSLPLYSEAYLGETAPLRREETALLEDVFTKLPKNLLLALAKAETAKGLRMEIVGDDLPGAWAPYHWACLYDSGARVICIRRSLLAGPADSLREFLIHELAHVFFPVIAQESLFRSLWRQAQQDLPSARSNPTVDPYALSNEWDFAAETVRAFFNVPGEGTTLFGYSYGPADSDELKKKHPALYLAYLAFFNPLSEFFADTRLFHAGTLTRWREVEAELATARELPAAPHDVDEIIRTSVLV